MQYRLEIETDKALLHDYRQLSEVHPNPQFLIHQQVGVSRAPILILERTIDDEEGVR